MCQLQMGIIEPAFLCATNTQSQMVLRMSSSMSLRKFFLNENPEWVTAISSLYSPNYVTDLFSVLFVFMQVYCRKPLHEETSTHQPS